MKHFGTSESEYGTAITLADSSCIVLCQTVFDGPTQEILMGVSRTDANGHLQWSKVFKARENSVIKSICKWKDGYLILATTWDTGSSQYKLLLIRMSGNGDILWMKEYSASNADLATALMIYDNRFYITATADYNVGSLYTKLLWIQTDTSGTLLNSRMYESQYQTTCQASAINDDGRIGIACETNSFGIGSFSFMNVAALQMDTTGAIEWVRSIGTNYDDEITDMTAEGNDWLITGRTFFINSEADLSLYRIRNSGDVLSSDYYDAGTSQGEAARAIISRNNHSCVIAGDAGTFDERNMFLMEVDANANVVWAKQYPVSTIFTNYPYDVIALNNDSGYVFTGDLRPLTSFRNACLFRTDSVGDVGCFTQPLNIVRRNESVEVLTVNLNEVPVTTVESPIASTDYSISILENVICEFMSVGFTFNIDTACPLICLNFIDESVNAQTWHWDFPGGSPSSSDLSTPPPVCYDSVGIYHVKLTVTNGGVTDSMSMALSLEAFCDTSTFHIPNVITPNDDAANDQFVIKNLPEEFHLSIYNRWGNKLFESTDKNKMWPEKVSSEKPSDGVYYYVLEVFAEAHRGTYHGVISVLGK